MSQKTEPMDPQKVFCPQATCLARGQIARGNIVIHSQKERRYKCKVCGKTFAETKGTPLYRLHKSKEWTVIVIALLAHGCPLQAIVAALGWDERTVKRLAGQAGAQCQTVHEHRVAQPRDLGQVQADEIWVKAQGVVFWLALALQVQTRLWLGASVSCQRDLNLLETLLEQVRACAVCRPLLFCVDGFRGCIKAIRRPFREPLPTGKRGRPQLRPGDGIYMAQVVKQYTGRCVTGVVHRIVQGTPGMVQA